METLGEGRHLRLVRAGNWEFMQRKRCWAVAVILAVTDDGRVVFTEQFRPPVDRAVVELPAGLVGDVPGAEGEDIVAAARRELFEETGYEARAMTVLAEGPEAAGYAAEVVTFLRAEGIRKTGPGGGDESEKITVHEVPVRDVPAWLDARRAQGRLVDLKVYTGLYFLNV